MAYRINDKLEYIFQFRVNDENKICNFCKDHNITLFFEPFNSYHANIIYEQNIFEFPNEDIKNLFLLIFSDIIN